MKAHSDNTQLKDKQSAASKTPHKQAVAEPDNQILDNRDEAASQRKAREIADNSTSAKLAAQLQAMAGRKTSSAQPDLNAAAQLMALSPQGAKSAMLGAEERIALRNNLLNADANVEDFMRGVCYDAVAFVRFLSGANISNDQLLDTSGQGWLGAFNFTGGALWGGGAIAAGTAVGFYRLVDKQIFHASIAVGETTVRGINGGLLGAGWAAAPRDLSTLVPADGQDNTYLYDGTQIQVYLSAL
jgi:hypothetical protein